LRRARCHAAVRAWADAQAPQLLYLSRITLAEIRYGIERQPDPQLQTRLQAWLDDRLRPWFEGRILQLSEDVILEWRRMVQRGKARGYTFPQPDLLIAATAAVAGLRVATRNVADFVQTGVPALNPWTGENVG
jgi:predicted nucleic acid-binding protein